jgi:hypothetical protein
MLIVLIAALACAALRGVAAVAMSWRDVPQSNDDMVFF